MLFRDLFNTDFSNVSETTVKTNHNANDNKSHDNDESEASTYEISIKGLNKENKNSAIFNLIYNNYKNDFKNYNNSNNNKKANSLNLLNKINIWYDNEDINFINTLKIITDLKRKPGLFEIPNKRNERKNNNDDFNKIIINNSHSSILSNYHYLLEELNLQKSQMNIFYSPPLPLTIETIKDDLECLLKGIPSKLFYFNNQTLAFEIKSNSIRFPGSAKSLASNYLTYFLNFGSEVFLIMFMINVIFNKLDYCFAIRDFFVYLNMMMIDYFEMVTNYFKIIDLVAEDITSSNNYSINNNKNNRNTNDIDDIESVSESADENYNYTDNNCNDCGDKYFFTNRSKIKDLINSQINNNNQETKLFSLKDFLDFNNDDMNDMNNPNIIEYSFTGIYRFTNKLKLIIHEIYSILNLSQLIPEYLKQKQIRDMKINDIHETTLNTEYLDSGIQTYLLNNIITIKELSDYLLERKIKYLNSGVLKRKFFYSITNCVFKIYFNQIINALFTDEILSKDFFIQFNQHEIKTSNNNDNKGNKENSIISKIKLIPNLVPIFLEQHSSSIVQSVKMIRLIKHYYSELFNSISYYSLNFKTLINNFDTILSITFLNEFNLTKTRVFEEKKSMLKMLFKKRLIQITKIENEILLIKINYLNQRRALKHIEHEDFDLIRRNKQKEEYIKGLNKQLSEKNDRLQKEFEIKRKEEIRIINLEKDYEEIKKRLIEKYKNEYSNLINGVDSVNNEDNNDYDDLSNENMMIEDNSVSLNHIKLENLNINEDNKNKSNANIITNNQLQLQHISTRPTNIDVLDISFNNTIFDNSSTLNYKEPEASVCRKQIILKQNKNKPLPLGGLFNENFDIVYPEERFKFNAYNNAYSLVPKTNDPLKTKVDVDVIKNIEKYIEQSDALYGKENKEELDNIKSLISSSSSNNNNNNIGINNNASFINVFNLGINNNKDNQMNNENSNKKMQINNINNLIPDNAVIPRKLSSLQYQNNEDNILNRMFRDLNKQESKDKDIEPFKRKNVVEPSIHVPFEIYIQEVFSDLIKNQSLLISYSYSQLLIQVFNLKSHLILIRDVLLLNESHKYNYFIETIIDKNTLTLKSNNKIYLENIFHSNYCFNENYYKKIKLVSEYKDIISNNTEYSLINLNQDFNYKENIVFDCSEYDINFSISTIENAFRIEYRSPEYFDFIFNKQINDKFSFIFSRLLKFKCFSFMKSELLRILSLRKNELNGDEKAIKNQLREMRRITSITSNNNNINANDNKEDFLLNNPEVKEYLVIENYNNKRQRIIFQCFNIISEIEFFLFGNLVYSSYNKGVLEFVDCNENSINEDLENNSSSTSRFNINNVFTLKERIEEYTSIVINNFNEEVFNLLEKTYISLSLFYLKTLDIKEDENFSEVELMLLLKQVEFNCKVLRREYYSLIK